MGLPGSGKPICKDFKYFKADWLNADKLSQHNDWVQHKQVIRQVHRMKNLADRSKKFVVAVHLPFKETV